jgi:hypothetical protein
MKTKIAYFLLFVGLFLTACSDDILERYPLDGISEANFWKTEKDYETAIIAIYGQMQQGLFSSALPYWDNISDNGYGQHNHWSSMDIVTGNITPNTGGFVKDLYYSAWRSIARANIFLQHLKDYDGLKPEKKTLYEAEAKALRAFFYSYLYRCWGELPVIEEQLTLENQFQPKKPASEMLKLIMADLDFAIAHLPDVTYKESGGHWTAGAAKAYKARILLYDAYDAQGKAIVSQMQTVKDLLSSIHGYRLAPDFSDNFHDLKQEDCPEIIISVKFLAPNNRTDVDCGFGNWVAISPTASLISEFDMADGTPGTPVPYTGRGVINPTTFSNASLDLREPRAAKTVFMDRYRINGVSYRPSDPRPLGTGLQKFLSPNQTPPFGVGTLSQQDWIVVRYADVLLMLAEAENEINGPTKIAYNAVDSVRQRGQTSALPTGLNKNQMRERIRHERRIELAFEGERYFDLKRWKIAKEVLNNVKDAIVWYKFEDKHYYFPIPQDDVDRSGGILVQNPNYK